MTALFGIIVLHLVILFRTQSTKDKSVPYGSVIFFTLLLAAFVLFMMITMEEPKHLGGY